MAVAEFRQKRKELVPVYMNDWQVEDHLIAFSHRIKPLKTAVCRLMEAGMDVCRILWPDAAVPQSPLSLAVKLQETGVQLSAWRFSAGRASADEVLSCILYWYETIDLDTIQTCRTGSNYICKDDWITRRQDMATYFTQRADLHTFNPDLPFPTEEDEGGDKEEGGVDTSAEPSDGANAGH